MSTLTLELTSELLERLQAEADERRQSVEETAASLLEERLNRPPSDEESEQERVVRALREAGLLREPDPRLRQYSATLKQRLGSEAEQAERRKALKNRKLDPPLSQTIIEMRQ